MKIGFSGTQCSGKTTILKMLSEDEYFKDYKVFPSSASYIGNLGIKINENGNDDTQILIMSHLAANSIINGDFLYDRTVLDCIAYTKYLLKKRKISTDTYQYLKSVYDIAIRNYDIIFLLTPDFEMVDEQKDTRSKSKEFREDIHENLVQYSKILKEKHNIDIVLLTGELQKRYEKVLNTVKNFHNNEKYDIGVNVKNKHGELVFSEYTNVDISNLDLKFSGFNQRVKRLL